MANTMIDRRIEESTIKKYIQEQEIADIALDKLSVKKYANPFVQ